MATILVVDDRPSNREFLLTLLGFTGHHLLQARDGAEALTLVRAERPDLIITDLLMPTMDGYEFVQRLRADPELAATRVIFYSAVFAEREMSEMAHSCGVRTVLPKPCDAQAIFDAVNAELGLDMASAPPAANNAIAPLVAVAPGDRLAARLGALEQLCLRLIGERRPDALAAVFLQAVNDIIGADQLALCLLESDESRVRHLEGHGIDGALLLSHALDRTGLPGALLAARAPLRLTGGD
ncbi:response regulator, partial [Massilia horti]